MHFRVASYLPTQECLIEDQEHEESFDLTFLRGAYMQPELRAVRNVVPGSPNIAQFSSSSGEGYGAC